MNDKRNKQNYREWKRQWYLKNREAELLRKKEYRETPEGREASRTSWRNAWKTSKHKILARQAVRKALVSGKLKRLPCKECGEVKTDAHHPDYSKPLEVVWLCEPHHYHIHRGARKTDEGKYRW